MNTFEIGVALGKTVKYGLVIGAAAALIAACSGSKEDKPTTAAAAPAAVQQPELTPEEKKQKEFDAERTARGYILKQLIKQSAYDPDALKIKSPKYYKNGVCVEANGKNRFGGYVGFQEYCYLIDDKGVWKYSGPN